ncbi:hypothetical protein PIB30_078613 [Stylosanthes scabra]|uniref:F-box domain-containing protein n=1 Tax=Stylosanthes scabra TaxID=79078 RepID=A0ABU6ZPR1_9FABA|nr:hypothetical protein [Stylosanthes scabra]
MNCCNPSPGKVMSKSTRPRPPRWRQSPFLRVPEELIVEILVRVPATCLIHLKRVCRSWKNLISNPKFVRYQVERSIAHVVPTSHARIAYTGWLYGGNRIRFFYGLQICCYVVEPLHGLHIGMAANGGIRPEVCLWVCHVNDSTMNELRGEFVKGTFNWVVCGPDGDSVILYLDLGTKTYGQLCLPERDPDDDFSIIPVIGVLRNCHSVCFDHKKTHCTVWLLSKNQCWSQLAMIPHQTLTFAYVIKFKCLSTLYISDDDVLLVGESKGVRTYMVPSRVSNGGHELMRRLTTRNPTLLGTSRIWFSTCIQSVYLSAQMKSRTVIGREYI